MSCAMAWAAGGTDPTENRPRPPRTGPVPRIEAAWDGDVLGRRWIATGPDS